MSIISGHTTRAVGTVLTASIYNEDHLNHISNASTLNTDKMEGTPPPVVDGHAVVWNGVGGNALRTAGFAPVNKAGDTITGSLLVEGTFSTQSINTQSIEARWNGGTPFIDFSNDAGVDYDVRIILNSDDVLNIDGASAAGLQRGGFVIWDDDNYDTRVAAVSGGGTTNFLRADGTFAAPPAPPVGSITLATEQATTSGTFKDFTGIPAGVKRITVMLDGISYTTNGKSVAIQLGDSGGIEATGYAPYGPTTSFTVSFNVNAADTYYGAVSLDLMNSSSNKWMCTVPSIGGQTKSLSGTLDRVRILSDGTFDAGTVNISYES